MAIFDENDEGSGILHRKASDRFRRSWRTWLIGRPLSTADAPHQTISKKIGLAVFASDALSSVAYAPQEVLIVLAVAGTSAFAYSVPISLTIVVLLAILTLSYEQTLHAYPNGGGSYIVARDNLGTIPALTAAAALLTDYILTVAVSISSGVAQLVSAFPDLTPYRIWIAVALVMMVMVINLRGVRESGVTFAIPTYAFIFLMLLTVGVGLFRYLAGSLGTVVDPPELHLEGALQPIGLFLILRAFASGTTALTGIEAISDGILAFRQPRSRNAGTTLIVMSFILGTLLLGITLLARQVGAVPSESETLISQIARTAFANRGLLYLAVIAGTTVILIMAANTAFADFPRLSAIVAGDGYLPRQFTYRGSRLVFSRGIMALALIASLLIILFRASVTALIPLYAIGVFLSFTLSQGGMAHRWWKSGRLAPGEQRVERGSTLHHDRLWSAKMLINGFGALTTLVVTGIFAVTKFTTGAWIVILITPILVLTFMAIHRHYASLARSLSLEDYGEPPPVSRHRVIIPVSGVHRGSLAALSYARALSDDVTAVHISLDAEEADKIRRKWDTWGEGVRLVILDSPYRTLHEPLLDYIEEVNSTRQPNEVITIVVPQFVPKKLIHNVLHTQTAVTLRLALLFRRHIVVTDVPYQVE